MEQDKQYGEQNLYLDDDDEIEDDDDDEIENDEEEDVDVVVNVCV